MKIENRSRKRSHKLDGIGVGRIRTFSFLLIPFTTPSLMIKWKLACRSLKQKWKNQPVARHAIEQCHLSHHWLFFRLCLRLRQCSFHLIISDGVISRVSILLPTPSVWFSPDRIALRFWLRLRLWLRRKWKPALKIVSSQPSVAWYKSANQKIGIRTVNESWIIINYIL